MERAGVPRDTSGAIEQRQIEGLRRMTPSERLAKLAALCRAADELAIAGLKLREGDLSRAELRRRLAAVRYGDDVVRQVEAYRASRDERR